jgi:hypothetical protein
MGNFFSILNFSSLRILRLTFYILIFTPLFSYAQLHELSENDFTTKFQETSSSIPNTKNITPSTSSTPAPDSLDFWDKLNSGVLDNLCKQAKIRLNKDYTHSKCSRYKRWYQEIF